MNQVATEGVGVLFERGRWGQDNLTRLDLAIQPPLRQEIRKVYIFINMLKRFNLDIDCFNIIVANSFI